MVSGCFAPYIELEVQMVFLVLTRDGYEELVALLGKPPSPLWVNAGVLSTTELSHLREAGYDVTDFVKSIDIQNNSGLETVIDTVQQHHFGHRVWVEYATDL